MSCFPCFQSKQQSESKEVTVPVAHPRDLPTSHSSVNTKQKGSTSAKAKRNVSTLVNTKTDDANAVDPSSENISAKTFTFRELATATKNFRQECLIGEGGYGRVFKGALQPSGQVVTVKQLDKNSSQGNKEFLVEVMMLSLLHHPNLVDLIGYCADGDQRLLVYEYLQMGSVEDHLLDLTPEKKPLDWVTRMKIASGTAQGLEYLHDKANPPVTYRDLKSSNILLDEEYNPKLYDYGLAKLGGSNTHATPRVMGNYGYCAPEYERHGEVTLKSDVYSFGVILLELITGRRALDTNRPAEEQNLVAWAQPFFRDPKRFPEMADPRLGEVFPVTSLNQAVGVAAMCLQDEPAVRPIICDVVAALSSLAVASPGTPVPTSTLQAPVSDQRNVAVAPPDQSGPNNLQPPVDGRSYTVASPHQPAPNTHQASIDHMNDAMAAAVLPVAVQDLRDSFSRKSDGSESMKHEYEYHNQEDRDGSDNESWPSPLSRDEYDENDGLDFEVASMSSCSISSINESQHGSFNKIRYGGNAEVQPGNKSLKLKRASTRKTLEGSVHSRRRNEESSDLAVGVGTRNRTLSVRTSARVQSSRKLDNGSVGLSTNQRSSERSKSRNFRSYSRAMSIVEPRNNRKIMSAHYQNKDFEEEKLLTSAS